jgi:hypothetical protein
MSEIIMPSASAIMRELARRSFEYWAPYYYSILDKQGKHTTLHLNYMQREIEREENEMMAQKGEVRLYVLKGRQGGVTTQQQGKSLETSVKHPGSTVLTMAHDRDSTDKIFEMTRYAIENFPAGDLPEVSPGKAREIKFPEINSRFFTGTAGARRTGRGLTLRRFHASEFAFWDKPKRSLKTVTGGLIPRGSVVVLETTASGFDTEAHQFWRDAKAGINSYRALFFPWWQCDVVNYRKPLMSPDELNPITDEEKVLIKEQGLTLEQIAWRRDKIKDMGGLDDFLQEYPEDDESCWLAVGGMYYPVADLRKLQQMAPKPIRIEMGGELEIYSDDIGNENVIMGVDTAEGTNNDRSTFVARAFPSWRLLRKYASAKITPTDFATVLDEQGRILDMAYMVIEKNMHGITVLRRMRDDLSYPVGRIYHRVVLDKAHPDIPAKIGWATTGESKPIMLAAGRELFTSALQGLAGMPSKDAVSEAFGVRRGEDGKFNLNGRDVLVAEMLAWIGRSAPTGLGMLDWIKDQQRQNEESDNPNS